MVTGKHFTEPVFSLCDIIKFIAHDASGADVIVLSRALAEKLVGTSNPVGQRVTVLGRPYMVTGVLKTWDVVTPPWTGSKLRTS